MKGERGYSLVESILLGLLFMTPLLWSLGALADIHRAALGSSAAVREAGDRVTGSVSSTEARASIDVAVTEVLRDHGLDPAEAEVRWRSGIALRRGAVVEIAISYPVQVLRAPFIGAVGPAIIVKARHVATVEPYASRPE